VIRAESSGHASFLEVAQAAKLARFAAACTGAERPSQTLPPTPADIDTLAPSSYSRGYHFRVDVVGESGGSGLAARWYVRRFDMTRMVQRWARLTWFLWTWLGACDTPLSGALPVDPGAPGLQGGAVGPTSSPPNPGDARGTGLDAGAIGQPACQSRFASSFEAIQKVIFEGRGCTASACHGAAAVGRLDLRDGVAWSNLVEASSANSAYARVRAGSASESFLYLKLQAATEPGRVQVGGSPMPIGAPALTSTELEAIRLWITKGAPASGDVLDAGLLDGCVGTTRSGPVKAEPLPPPGVDDGIQLVLPHYPLKGQTEVENCTPFSYDFSELVPQEYKDVGRNVMYVNGSHVRQDPQSHHLILWNSGKGLSSVATNDAAWTCRGGARDGRPCNAQKGGAECGDGAACAGSTTPGSLCGVETLAFGSGTTADILAGLAGLGPKPLTLDDYLALGGIVFGGGMPVQIANAQSAQQDLPPIDGVYMQLPLSGILWFNSHAFNLTERDTTLDARVNWLYAKKREREMRRVSNTDSNNVAHGQPPFTRKTYCASHEVPQGYSLAMMTGHTHRHGEHFWVNDASGTKIYENFDYKDPAYTEFKPWMEFTSADPAARTLEFCATFNNGLKNDDTPDTTLVTRASRMPERGKCTPVACVAGKVAAACTSDHDCDSTAGANDGHCDACPITAGQTTENEMFVLMNWYVLPPKS